MSTTALISWRSEPTVLQHVAHAVWKETRSERSHRYHRGLYCPTRVAPYSTDDPYGRAIHEFCAASGCVDLLHDVIARVLTKLDASTKPVVNVAAFCYRVARRELVEVKRAERTKAGFSARPSRSDGVAGRVDAALQDTGNGTADWLVALFRILRAYPYSPTHIPGRWPVEGLMQERETRLPCEASSPEIVRAEIAHVLRVATTVAGYQWVYDNLTFPLHAHGADSELPETLSAPLEDRETTILSARLKESYQRLRLAGLSREEALNRAALTVTGLVAPALTADLVKALKELEPELAT